MVLAHNIDDGERTQDVQISQSVTFDSMLLSADTLNGLKSSGFYKPSPIQLHGIPLGKCGFDLLLEAKSGTGKTAVFSVIALEQLNLENGLQVIILAPTREIAAQICNVIKQIGSSFEGLRVEVVMGGLPVEDDIRKFKHNNVHIVVGSPGRLLHLILDKIIDISSVRLLVLDEADRLLEKSFLDDINRIFSVMPKQKQVIMSSATYPEKTKTFIKQYVRNAQHICPDTNNILLGITQKLAVVDHSTNIVKQTKIRFDELLKILKKQAFKQCLIFCNYQARVTDLHKLLTRHGWPAQQLYGLQEQLDRLGALKSLQEYKCRILIATDLAARGIDASNVDLVINFEPAHDWQIYLHRIGRAGRFGSYGLAITILSKGVEQQKFKNILSTIKLPINLSSMWEDGEVLYSYDGLETSSVSQLSEPSTSDSLALKSTEKCDTLWNLLTSDHKVNADNLEDFQNLCSSFNSVDTKQVECFSDLLSSLEGHQHIVNGTNNYHHLKIQKIHFPKYIKVCPATIKSNSKEKSHEVKSSQNSDYKLEINNNICGKTAEVKQHCDLKVNKDLVSKTKTKKVDRTFQNCKDDTKCRFKEEGLAVSCDEYEVTTSSQALLNAGLPTAFGKQKISRKEAKAKYKYESYIPNSQKNVDEEKTTNKNKLSYKDTEDSDTSQGFYNIRKEKSQLKNGIMHSKPVGSGESGYDVDCENYYNYYKTLRSPYYKHPKANKTETDDSCDSTCDSSTENSHSATNLTYINWYNTLKMRARQVELAIYVEEMCKRY